MTTIQTETNIPEDVADVVRDSRLRRIAGIDTGYIFIVVRASGETTIDYSGFDVETIPAGLRELADNLEARL